MAREKKPVHRVQMAEGKRNIIHQLLEEYDILIICADAYGYQRSDRCSIS